MKRLNHLHHFFLISSTLYKRINSIKANDELDTRFGIWSHEVNQIGKGYEL